MTTSWKIFACVLALAVATAIVMGTTSQSPKGHATLTGADGKGSTDPNSVPFPAPPGDGILPKNAPPPPPAQTTGPQGTPSIPSAPTPAVTTASSSTPAPSSTSSAPSTPAQAPSGVSSFSSQYAAPSQDQSNESDTDVSQSAPTETAAQRVGKKIRGR